ncbi:hypothetical protein LWM68_00135 [Niabella sp. W65]|nr:hypothetical protein [Niabella sp. W65]MCH7361332.1 hypothetical protein [Niabella sp. W65]
MAEALAYNREGIGLIGGMEEMDGGNYHTPLPLTQQQKDYIRFLKIILIIIAVQQILQM